MKDDRLLLNAIEDGELPVFVLTVGRSSRIFQFQDFTYMILT